MLDTYSLAVLIPAHNEQGAIGQTISEIKKLLPKAQIVVCDNHSTDLTAIEAQEAGAQVITEKRKGKGNAVRRLMTAVQADIFILVDGDNTYDLNHLPVALDFFHRNSMDLMTGNRLSSVNSHMRAGHGIGNTLFTRSLRLFLDVQTQDVFSGLRIMSRRLIRSFPLVSTEFEIETELSIFAARMRIPQADFPTSVRERIGTASKLNTFRDGFRILFFVLRSVHREYPLKIYLPISIFLIITSFLSLGDLYVDFLETGSVLRLPTLIVACIVLLSGIFSFITGIILREISAIKYQSRYLAYINVESFNA